MAWMQKNDLYGNYRNLKFTDIYKSADEFINGTEDFLGYKTCGIPQQVTEETARTIYALLYGRYGNHIIASSDYNRFTVELFSLIYEHAPNWERRQELQKKIIGLTDQDLVVGSKQIFNNAANPETKPSTDELNILPYIDQQSVSNHKRSKIEAYKMGMDMLEDNVTTYFLDKFKKLFMAVVTPEEPLLYEEDE